MPGSRIALLRNAPYRNYFLARSASTFGNSFGTLAVTFAVLEIDGSAASLGLVLGSMALPALAFMLVGGAFGDRFERRRILIVSDLVMCATQVAAAFLFFADALTIPLLVALTLVRGSAYSFFAPASTGMMPSIVEADRLQAANALLGLARNAIGIVGPILAGLAIAIWSPGVALAVNAATYVFSSAFVWLLPRSQGRLALGSSVMEDVRAGWSAFASRDWVWKMVLSFAIYQASVLPAIMLIGPLLSESSGVGAAGWAIVLSARAAGSLVAGLVLLKWRPRSPLVSVVALLFLDVPFLLAMAIGTPLPIQAGAAVLSAVGVVCSDTLWITTLQRRVPEDVLSRVSSYDGLGSLVMNPLGFLLVGVAAATFGAAKVLLVVIAMHILTRLLLLRSPSLRESSRDAAASPS